MPILKPLCRKGSTDRPFVFSPYYGEEAMRKYTEYVMLSHITAGLYVPPISSFFLLE
nr:MAG TPA: hypothetical protein [Caudoviricetes sp.]